MGRVIDIIAFVATTDELISISIVPDTELFIELVAVIVTDPTDNNVTKPVPFTVATEVFDELQIIPVCVVSLGVRDALNYIVLPTSPDVLPVTAIAVTGTSDREQVNVQLSDSYEFSWDVTVIVTVPYDRTVTSPEELTVAIAVFEELHITVLFVAFDGTYVTYNCVLFITDVGFVVIFIEVRLMFSSFTIVTVPRFVIVVKSGIIIDFPMILYIYICYIV